MSLAEASPAASAGLIAPHGGVLVDLMVPESEPLPDEELEVEDFDAIPVGRELNLAELIEDELLLNLPLSPMHDQCALPGPAENGEKQSPFAALAQLKRGH